MLRCHLIAINHTQAASLNGEHMGVKHKRSLGKTVVN